MQKIVLKTSEYWSAEIIIGMIELDSEYVKKIEWDSDKFQKFIKHYDMEIKLDKYVIFSDQDFDRVFSFRHQFASQKQEQEQEEGQEREQEHEESPLIIEYSISGNPKKLEQFRTDPNLISIVEKLNNPHFKIVEIPDEIDWFFDNPCDEEIICENYKYWVASGEHFFAKRTFGRFLSSK